MKRQKKKSTENEMAAASYEEFEKQETEALMENCKHLTVNRQLWRRIVEQWA